MSAKAMILSVGRRRIESADGEYRQKRDSKGQRCEGIEQLAEDVWLIPLPRGMPFFAKIASVADFVGYPYKTMLIEHEAVWAKYGQTKE